MGFKEFSRLVEEIYSFKFDAKSFKSGANANSKGLSKKDTQNMTL